MTTGGHSPLRSSSKSLSSLLVSANDTQSILFLLHKSVQGLTDSNNMHTWLRWLFTQSCWFLSSSSTTTSAAEQRVLKRQEREEESSRVAVLFLDWHHTRDDKWGLRCSPRWLFFITFFILYSTNDYMQADYECRWQWWTATTINARNIIIYGYYE